MVSNKVPVNIKTSAMIVKLESNLYVGPVNIVPNFRHDNGMHFIEVFFVLFMISTRLCVVCNLMTMTIHNAVEAKYCNNQVPFAKDQNMIHISNIKK